MPKTVRPLNDLGLWLNNELGKRGVLLIDFAKAAGITPQALSEIMRSQSMQDETKQRWRVRFGDALDSMSA